jgi:hypothetical protein
LAAADASKYLWISVAAFGGDRGAEIWIAVRPSWREARIARKALHQRIFLTHVEAGYFYNVNRPVRTACGRVLSDFGQVNERHGYSSLCALTAFARISTR